MTDDAWTWWGNLRRRHSEELPNRGEVATVLLQPAVLFNLVWLLLMSFAVTRFAIIGLLGFWTSTLYIPAVVALLTLAVGMLTNPEWFHKTYVGDIVAMAREKGRLGYWDMTIAIVAGATLVVGGVWRLRAQQWPTMLLLSSLIIVSGLCFSLFKKAPLESRRWKWKVPKWLELDEDDRKKLKDKDLPLEDLREEGAEVLPFDDLGRVNTDGYEGPYALGVRIDADKVLNPLRKMNCDSGGFYYQKDPLAVVLSKGEPAKGLGLDEIDRLVAQISWVARSKGLSRYQVAAGILKLVQKAITYEFDEDSTTSFPGGPYQEYGRFPAETIADRVGDCECTAILCASILTRSGFDCALLRVDVKGDGHMAVGLKADDELFHDKALQDLAYVKPKGSDDKYLYGETATDNEDPIGFGVIPTSWRDDMDFREVTPITAPSG